MIEGIFSTGYNWFDLWNNMVNCSAARIVRHQCSSCTQTAPSL